MSKKITLEGLDHFKDNENAMIAGKPESTNTATVAHAVGEYFYWKGVLHIVTAAIAVGGTIQTNTNVKPAVLADDVGALKESTTQLVSEVEAQFEQKTITDVPIASFNDGADGLPVKKLVVDIEPIQSGTGEPSPTNIRPITGWTGAKVTRMGKNLLDGNGFRDSFTQNGLTFTKVSGTHYKVDGTSTGMGWASLQNAGSPEISVKLPLGTYTMSCSTNKFNCYIARDENFTDYVNATVKVTSTGKPVYAIRLLFSSNVSFSNEDLYIQLEHGSSVTDYEEPKGNQISITFPSEAGTIYGGNLVIEQDGSGTLTVDKAIKNSGFARGATDSSGRLYNIGEVADGIYGGNQDLYIGKVTCSALPITGLEAARSFTSPCITYFGTQINSQTIYVGGYIGKESELDTLISSGNLTLVYPIATPLTYPLNADQITTLLGANNIWADTGDVEVTYRAMNNTSGMIKLTKALIAPVLDSMVADTALVVNDFRIVGDTLYKVTAPIASGGTLTVGTNVATTTIGAQITALLNA